MEEPDFSELKKAIVKKQGSVICPHCEKEIPVAMVARASEETSLSFVITVEEGHLLSADSVGGMLVSFDKLMKAASREMGGKCLSLIKGMSQTTTTITFDFLIVQPASPIYKANVATKSKRAGTHPTEASAGDTSENIGDSDEGKEK